MKVGDRHYRSIWADERPGGVTIIDQQRLPHVFETRTIGTVGEMAEAIRTMRVRGAPLIGVAAAFGVALAMLKDQRDSALTKAIAELRETRPTAVNLAWALARMEAVLAAMPPSQRAGTAWEEA